MNNEINNNSAKGIRLVGNIIVVIGIIFLLVSQIMEITAKPDYANMDTELIASSPEKVINFSLMFYKINYLMLGGLLILIGIKLSLVSNKTISNLKKETNKKSQNKKELIKQNQKNINLTTDEQNTEPKKFTKFSLDRNVCTACQNPLHESDKKCTNCGLIIIE